MTRGQRSFEGVIRAAVEVLRRNRVDHVFVGAISVVIFGIPRTTSDVDVLARLTARNAGALTEDFRRRGFLASAPELLEALREGSHCTIEDSRSPYRIDLAPFVTDEDRHALRGGVPVRWRRIPLFVAGPEHTVVMKLTYGSDQDVEDALGILAHQSGSLDRRGMRRFARDQGVSARLRTLERKAEALEQESHP